ncbi:MAG: mechanosensitive ion channel protein MscS [Pelagibacterales bacterium]|nr:mechanosensitive ion channel protein MscS [Pelagibacterales bacterium]PPR16720.1 MAG: Miniconductance mechanosensitive channel YbdG [Alphaproteobacteria bacterium MarineAlpha9_Bin3]|tara:strand:- start:2716 stop:3993 length:1278 start_codon:yes stop_codon:yes gene_type:complete
MESFSSIVETFLSIIKNFINNNILIPSGNIWLSDVFFYHLLLVILLTAVFSLIFNKLIIVFIRSWLRKLNFNIGKQLLEKKVLVPIGWAIPILIFEAGLGNYSPEEGVIARLMKSLITLIFILSLTRFISAISDVLKGNKTFTGTPIQSYMQLIKLIIYLFGIIIIVCTLSNTSPWTILSGLGALTAILLLVFKDTILGLVASIQVFGSDTIREGDWVTIPSLNIDGDCIEVGLHTVTVRSWDKALITFPSAKLLEHPFKNWRGMEEAGGRRIKRAIFIDQESICFIDKPLKEKLLKISLLTKHFEAKKKEIEKANAQLDEDTINHRKLTNIGVFRSYLIEYLKNHEKINENLTLMVRQLAPGSSGLPVEIYAFTSSVEWTDYESVQSDIFDHILAIISLFDLKLTQSPSGHDIKNFLINYDQKK